MPKINESVLARDFEKLVSQLPETISREDLERHPWLRKLVLVADQLDNKVPYNLLDALKHGWIK